MGRSGDLYIQLDLDYADDADGLARAADFGKDARAVRELFIQMICYCKRTKSDGHIPAAQVGKLVYPDLPRIGRRDAERLVTLDLLERTEKGYYMPSFLKRNKSKAEIEAGSASLSESGHEAGVYGSHVRWHEGRDLVDPTCVHCQANSQPHKPRSGSDGVIPMGANNSETETETETETKELAPPKATREPDEIWDALLAACGINGLEVTKPQRGSLNKAVADLRSVGATPIEIKLRAKRYREKFAGAALTPPALAKHWAALSLSTASTSSRTVVEGGW